MTSQPPPPDPWDEVSQQWSTIGARLRQHYRDLTDDERPSEDELREAVSTLRTAGKAMVESLGSAMQDPEVRDQVKQAVSSLASAVGETLSELARELRRPEEAKEAEDTTD